LISGIEDRISCKRWAVNRSEGVGTTAPVELILDHIEQRAMSGFREAGDIPALWL